MDEILNLFSMLSDKTRLRILLLLQERELCVCEIFAALDMSQPRVSRQLAVLKQARLIKDRRNGKWIYYRIEQNEYSRYLRSILTLLPEWLKDDPEFTDDQSQIRKIADIKSKMEACNCILTGGVKNGKE